MKRSIFFFPVIMLTALPIFAAEQTKEPSIADRLAATEEKKALPTPITILANAPLLRQAESTPLKNQGPTEEEEFDLCVQTLITTNIVPKGAAAAASANADEMPIGKKLNSRVYKQCSNNKCGIVYEGNGAWLRCMNCQSPVVTLQGYRPTELHLTKEQEAELKQKQIIATAMTQTKRFTSQKKHLQRIADEQKKRHDKFVQRTAAAKKQFEDEGVALAKQLQEKQQHIDAQAKNQADAQKALAELQKPKQKKAAAKSGFFGLW